MSPRCALSQVSAFTNFVACFWSSELSRFRLSKLFDWLVTNGYPSKRVEYRVTMSPLPLNQRLEVVHVTSNRSNTLANAPGSSTVQIRSICFPSLREIKHSQHVVAQGTD